MTWRRCYRLGAIALAIVVLSTLWFGALGAQDGADDAETRARKRTEAGKSAMIEANFAEAARILRSVYLDFPDAAAAPEAAYVAGRAMLMDRQPREVLPHAMRVIRRYPKSPWVLKARYLLADAYVQLRNYRDASTIYRERTAFLTGDTYLLRIGAFYLEIAEQAYIGQDQPNPDPLGPPVRVRDFQTAMTFYARAMAVRIPAEREYELLFKLADCQFRLNQFGPARTTAQRILVAAAAPTPEATPRFTKAQRALAQKYEAAATFLVGEASMRLGDFAAAREFLITVAEGFRDHERAPDALILLGDTYRPLAPASKQDFERGVRYWETYATKYWGHARAPQVFLNIAQAYFNRGNYETAIEKWQAFLAKFGEHEQAATATFSIAQAHLALKQFEPARQTYKKFLGEYPADRRWTQAQNQIAESYYLEGREDYASGQALLAEIDFTSPVTAESRTLTPEQRTTLESRWAVAKKVWDRFLRTYPVHARAPQTQLSIARMAHALARLDARAIELVAARQARALTVDEQLARRACFARILPAYLAVVTKYQGTQPGAQAQFTIAETQQYELGALAEAMRAYERVVRNFSQFWNIANRARQIMNQMRATEFRVTARRAFTTHETAGVRVLTRNVEQLSFRLYRLNLQEYFRKYHNIGNVEAIAVEIVEPTVVWDAAVPEYRPFQQFNRDYALKVPDGPGAYVLEVRSPRQRARVLVLVSDLSIITKQSPKHALVYAADATTGAPKPGVTVLVSDGSKIVAEGVTGRMGIFQHALDKPARNVRLFAFEGKSYAFSASTAATQVAFGYTEKGYVFTDRPVYRPAQTVAFKATLRGVSAGAYTVPTGVRVPVTITNPRGVVHYRDTLTTNSFGSISGELRLTEEPPLGSWTIRASWNGHTFTGTFAVEEYKKPEFVVDVVPQQAEGYLTNERVVCEVAVRYYFGQPVRNAPVKWTLFAKPYTFDASVHESYAWFNRETNKARDRARRQGRDWTFIARGTAKADAEGRCEVAFDTKTNRDTVYFLQVEALDVNRRWVQGGAQIVAATQGYYAILKSSQNVVRPGETLRATLTTVNAGHAPVGRKGVVKIFRALWRNNRTFEQAFGEQPATTGADGLGEVAVTINEPGNYVLRFSGEDRRGTPITASTEFVVAGDQDQSRQARVIADREIYNQGDTAQLMIQVPKAPAWALLTFEGERVLEHRVVKLSRTTTLLPVVMTGKHAPNVFVKLAVAYEHQLFEGEDEILVFRFLKIDVKTDKPVYGPGEKATYTITTTDQKGNPVAAEVALGVIDSAVYAIRPDSTPDMKPFFYDQRRKNLVTTASSLAWKYLGQTTDLPPEMMSELERRKFDQLQQQLQGAREKDMRRLQEMLRRERGRYANEPPASNAMPAPAGRARALRDGAFADDEANEDPSARRYGAARSNAPEGKLRREIGPGLALGTKKQEEMQGFMNRLGIGGGAAGGGLGPQLVKPTIRKRFADTALWRPHVITTRATGTASFSVTLPDNLTSWRATARGASKETLVGETTQTITVTKKVLTRLDTPRFLTQGDRLTVSSITHNYTKTPLATTVTLQGERIGVAGGSATATIKAREEHRHDFKVTAANPGSVKLTAKALTTVESDATERLLQVLPFGTPHVVGRSGALADWALATFEYPKEVIPGTTQAYVLITAGIPAAMLDALQQTHGFPYGCFEQTVNRFVPTLMTKRAMQRLGLGTQDLDAYLDKAADLGLRRLYDMQNNDGTWGWWARGRGNPTMTALGLWALETAKILGCSVESQPLNQARRAAQSLMRRGATRDQRAMLVRALSMSRRAGRTDLLALQREADDLTTYALGALALTFSNQNDLANAQRIVERIAARGRRDLKGLVTFAGDADSRSGWMSGTLETTAMAATAIARIQPNNPLLPGAIRSLLASRTGLGWRSTKATGDVILALSTYLERQQFTTPDFEVDVEVNGKRVARKRGTAISRFADRLIPIDVKFLKPGTNRLRIARRGGDQLTYSFVLRTTTPADEVKPADNHLVSIARKYAPWTPAFARQNTTKPGYSILRSRYRPRIPEPPHATQVTTGDKIGVTLTVDVSETLEYVMIEDALPAGFEVTSDDRQNTGQRFERRDEKVAMFFTQLTPGKHYIHYVIQAVTPGRFRVLPATVVPMYAPEINARTGSTHMRVFDLGERPENPSVSRQKTPDETYAKIREFYEAARWADADVLITQLLGRYERQLLPSPHEQLLAWQFRAKFHRADHQGSVRVYERLRTVNPRRANQLTRVERRDLAESYAAIGDHESALGHAKIVIDQTFQLAGQVGEAYRTLGRQMKAQEYDQDLARQFPDGEPVIRMRYERARRFASIPLENDPNAEFRFFQASGVSTRVEQAFNELQQFGALFATHPLADDAMYQGIAMLARLEAYPTAILEEQRFIRRFSQPESPMLDDVYLQLATHEFLTAKYEEALKTASTLANRKFLEHGYWTRGYGSHRVPNYSPFRYAAWHLIAKIHHTEGRWAKAVQYYDKVRSRFTDAADAYRFFTREELEVPEVSTFASDAQATLHVEHKNVETLELKLYRVDFLILFALRKDLTKINDINLTGIDPLRSWKVALKQPRPYTRTSSELDVDVKQTGVYLVVVKAKNFDATSVIIKSDLELRVQREAGNRVRVYVTDNKGTPVKNVYVKIASGNTFVASGKTDSRGVFEGTTNQNGKLAVVATKDGHYALHRDQ